MINPKQTLFLIGAGGHGKVIAEIAESLGFVVAGFVDHASVRKTHLGYPVFPEPADTGMPKEAGWVISIGNNFTRKKLAQQYALSYRALLHPSVLLSPRSTIGAGTVAMAGVVVNSSTTIGKHCILNTSCTVDHDCRLGDFVHVAPQTAIAGGVTIGEGSLIGIGARVIPGVTIGKWCTIGAGAVVLSDVPDGAIVVGIPGKILHKQDKG